MNLPSCSVMMSLGYCLKQILIGVLVTFTKQDFSFCFFTKQDLKDT
jgi:hypothetical protein